MCYTDASRAVFGSGQQQQTAVAPPVPGQVGQRGSAASPGTSTRSPANSPSPFRRDLAIPTSSPSGGGINIPQ